MSCQHCVRAVFTSLTGVYGITRADVSIGMAEIEHDGAVDLESVRAAIGVAGYAMGDVVVDRRRLPTI